MTPYWKGLLKLVVSVYMVWHVGVFFSFFPFFGHNKAIGYATMIICTVIYVLAAKMRKGKEKTDNDQ